MKGESARNRREQQVGEEGRPNPTPNSLTAEGGEQMGRRKTREAIRARAHRPTTPSGEKGEEEKASTEEKAPQGSTGGTTREHGKAGTKDHKKSKHRRQAPKTTKRASTEGKHQSQTQRGPKGKGERGGGTQKAGEPEGRNKKADQKGGHPRRKHKRQARKGRHPRPNGAPTGNTKGSTKKAARQGKHEKAENKKAARQGPLTPSPLKGGGRGGRHTKAP